MLIINSDFQCGNIDVRDICMQQFVCRIPFYLFYFHDFDEVREINFNYDVTIGGRRL